MATPQDADMLAGGVFALALDIEIVLAAWAGRIGQVIGRGQAGSPCFAFPSPERNRFDSPAKVTQGTQGKLRSLQLLH